MNGLLICVVIIFGQIYNNAGQEPPTQTAGDLTEFVSGPNDSVPELDTPSPTSEINQTRADDMANYDELVGSIFYQNSSLNEPDVIVVSVICAFLVQKVSSTVLGCQMK